MSDFQLVLELLGEDATIKLLEAYGGTRRGVPKVLPGHHELRDLLGNEDFEKLHQYFGGYELDLPLAKRWRLTIYRARGLKTKEIARRTGYSERAVARILNDEAKASWQMNLQF